MTSNQQMGINFYLRKATKDGKFAKNSTAIDIEAAYEGLTYASAEGLLDVGKIKNVYTETYSESDRLRVHYPEEPTHEATKVKFTFVIIGENRQAVYDSFYEDITSGFWYYWDNKRNRYLHFFFSNEYKTSEELWVGSTPWIKLEIEVQNVWGRTFDIEPQVEV